jgi:hypothetical protein
MAFFYPALSETDVKQVHGLRNGVRDLYAQ